MGLKGLFVDNFLASLKTVPEGKSKFKFIIIRLYLFGFDIGLRKDYLGDKLSLEPENKQYIPGNKLSPQAIATSEVSMVRT